MRRTLASPIFAISSKRPSAIFAEVLSASIRTARRAERASEGMTATRIQSNGGFHMRVAPLNDLIFNRITIQSDRSMTAGALLRPGTVCRSSCYTFLPRLRPIRSSAVRFAADSPLEGDGFDPSVPRGESAAVDKPDTVQRQALSAKFPRPIPPNSPEGRQINAVGAARR